MWVISRRRLHEFWETHAEAKRRLAAWYKIVDTAQWSSFRDVKAVFPTADSVGRLVVFDVLSYRVIARIEYMQHKVFIRAVLTHKEYDRNDWKNDPWF
jgi:mRNA interferase HigB